MRKILLGMMILCLSLLGLSGAAAQADSPFPTDGWLTSTPELQGIDSGVLAGAYEAVQEHGLNLHSLLVIRHGYLVAEMYRYPYTADTLHDQRSVTKSNVATLVGIAINEGAISGIDAPLLSFFPDQTVENVDARKQAITLENMLTMSSGLQWDESRDILPMVSNPDWAAWMLNRSVVEEPGTHFNYSSASTNLLAAVVENATGQALADYASAKLYGPLGITHFRWDREPGGHTLGGFGLNMTPRDMAKLGYLYLHHGEWDGAQIVPAEWVAAATSPQAPVNPQDDLTYGYQWWMPADDAGQPAFMALGYGGQLIYVLPELDMVVVATAGGVDFDADIFPLVNDFVIPAAAADAPLPENAEAQARLQAAIDALQQPHPQPVPELPDMATAISGNSYKFSFPSFYSGWREFGWKSMGLTFDTESAEATFTVGLLDGQTAVLPVGMDGVPRVGEQLGNDFLALRGTWMTPDTFALELQFLGLPEHWVLMTQYADDEMRITFQELVTGESRTLIGVQES